VADSDRQNEMSILVDFVSSLILQCFARIEIKIDRLTNSMYKLEDTLSVMKTQASFRSHVPIPHELEIQPINYRL
jgi:hypothetical protein